MHGGLANDCKVDLEYIDSEQIEQRGRRRRSSPSLDAVLVPGGFGDRGTEGKIAAIGYARENKIPFFGICLGHAARRRRVRARTSRGSRAPTRASSTATRPYPVIDLMPEQRGVREQGRARCASAPTRACSCRARSPPRPTATTEISERHRHRYEFANDYREQLAAGGPRPQRARRPTSGSSR